MAYPIRPKNLRKKGVDEDNIAALRDLQRKVTELTEGQTNADGTGALVWNAAKGTYEITVTGGSTFGIGEDLVYYAKNTSGSTIPIGTPVMFTGAVGASGTLTFGKAVADGSVDPDYMMGVTLQDVPNNGFGYVKDFGLVRGLRTDGVPQGETWSDGDILYFSPAAPGSWTKVKPSAPAISTPVAVVVNAAIGGIGSIFVRFTPGQKLNNLSNVYAPSPTNGVTLIYDAAQSRWEASTLTAGTGISISNGAGSITISSTSSASVSSVGLSAPTGFTVSGSPITNSGTLALGFATGYSLPTNADQSNWNTAYGWGNHAAAGYLTTYTETDPVFSASPAAGITNTNISNWNTAYGWGNHASAGYLTSFTESDPTVGSHIKAITTTNISNWNTAYSWGNHASAGYLTSETYTGTVTSVSGTGTVNGITLTGTVTGSGSLTLGGTLSVPTSQITGLATVATSGSFADLSNKPGFRSNGQNVIGGSMTLGSSDKGTNLLVVTSGITITFPASGYASGEGVLISNVSGGNITFSFAYGSDMGTTFPNGASIIAICDGGGFWRQYCYSTSRL